MSTSTYLRAAYGQYTQHTWEFVDLKATELDKVPVTEHKRHGIGCWTWDLDSPIAQDAVGRGHLSGYLVINEDLMAAERDDLIGHTLPPVRLTSDYAGYKAGTIVVCAYPHSDNNEAVSTLLVLTDGTSGHRPYVAAP